jgi:hypothetical protein
MKCKVCKKDLVIPSRAYRNLESYNVGGSCIVASECCGTGYKVQMNVSYTTTLYEGDKEADDWGEKMKKGVKDPLAQ